jgi:hypothetical protein
MGAPHIPNWAQKFRKRGQGYYDNFERPNFTNLFSTTPNR